MNPNLFMKLAKVAYFLLKLDNSHTETPAAVTICCSKVYSNNLHTEILPIHVRFKYPIVKSWVDMGSDCFSS